MELVDIVRSVLVQQGFPPDVIDSAGKMNLTAIAAGLYDTVEIHSKLTPPIVLNLKDALASGPPNPIVAWAQPTVVLRGKRGRVVVAPYGESEGSILPLLALAGGLVGLGYVLGS